MTSAGFHFGVRGGSKREAKDEVEVDGGMELWIDIGRWRAKKEESLTSV